MSEESQFQTVFRFKYNILSLKEMGNYKYVSFVKYIKLTSYLVPQAERFQQLAKSDKNENSLQNFNKD